MDSPHTDEKAENALIAPMRKMCLSSVLLVEAGPVGEGVGISPLGVPIRPCGEAPLQTRMTRSIEPYSAAVKDLFCHIR